MSTITDTQSFLFTRIPSAIKKTWSPDILSVSDKTRVSVPSKYHEDSLIQKVELSVEFHSLLSEVPTELNNQTDDDDHRIEVWQEARRDWASLEAAINEEITDFVNRAAKRAIQRRSTTVDALVKTRTEFVMEKPKTSVPPVVNPTHVRHDANTIIGPQVQTIVDYTDPNEPPIRPNDSVSMYGNKDLKDVAAEVIRANKSHSRSKHSTRKSFLQYLSEPARPQYSRR